MGYTKWSVRAARDYEKRLKKHAKAFLALAPIERAREAASEEDDDAALDVAHSDGPLDIARSIVQLVEPTLPQPPRAEGVAYAPQQAWLLSLIEDRGPEVVLVPDAGMQELPSVHSFAMHMYWALRHLDAIAPGAPERDALIDAARKALGRVLGPRGLKRGPTSTKAAIDGLATLIEHAFPALTRAEIAEVAVRTAIIVGVLPPEAADEEITKAAERAKKKRQRARSSGAPAEPPRRGGRKPRSR